MGCNYITWYKMYEKAVDYYIQYGNLDVPQDFKTEDGCNLGMWIHNQKKTFNPESKRGRLLLNIGLRFGNKKLKWEKVYEKAEEYFNQHGDLEVPISFITSDGYRLGVWIYVQRRKCDPLSEKGQLLLKIGMKFGNKYLSWEEAYERAEVYFRQYGDLKVPYDFKTEDGYNLGVWVSNQRSKCDPESERGKLLLKIGMKFANKLLSWEQVYEKAEEYFKQYGNLDVPYNFKTEDGYNLGSWIGYQRGHCDPLSERGQLLLKIGMRFDFSLKEKCEQGWLKGYKYALSYYEEHGNLIVPQVFKTEDGYSLGVWISRQRKAFKENALSLETICMLESIGMIWNVKKNMFDIVVLCDKYNIDVDINRIILMSISSTEFRVKLCYLDDNNSSIVDENGKLHEIFSMSSMNMKLKYGVSLEDLVNMYGKGLNK